MYVHWVANMENKRISVIINMCAEPVVKEIPKVINKKICLQRMSVVLIWISFSRVYNRKFSCSLIQQSDGSTNIKTDSFMSSTSLVICEVLLKSIQKLKTTGPSSGRSIISQRGWDFPPKWIQISRNPPENENEMELCITGDLSHPLPFPKAGTILWTVTWQCPENEDTHFFWCTKSQRQM